MRLTSPRVALLTGLVLVTGITYLAGFHYYIHKGSFWIYSVSYFCQTESKGELKVANDSLYFYHLHDKIANSSSFLRTDRNKIAVSGKKRNKVRTEAGNKTLVVTANILTDGRLGNQLFRYASLFGIARSQGRKLLVTSGSDLQDTFKLNHVDVNKTIKNWEVIVEANALSFDEKLMELPLKDLKIHGYLQSYKYFNSFEDELRLEFMFRDSVAKDAALIIHDVQTERRGSLVVGVHVRRGDFISKHNQEFGYAVPEISYFLKAFGWMKSKFPGRDIIFLVASDDLPWCNKTLSRHDVILMPPASQSIHMATLAKCDHVIISSGTYGWWSGWLAGGYVIYFTGFMRKNTSIGDTFVAKDYYPPVWIGLGN